MTRTQNAILRYAYAQYKTGITKPEIIYSEVSNSRPEARNALDSLQNDGYIEVLSPAMGCAIIRLTEYGFSFCEQSF